MAVGEPSMSDIGTGAGKGVGIRDGEEAEVVIASCFRFSPTARTSKNSALEKNYLADQAYRKRIVLNQHWHPRRSLREYSFLEVEWKL